MDKKQKPLKMINWQELVESNRLSDIDEFDEKAIYKDIRQSKLVEKCQNLKKRYKLIVEYNSEIDDYYYEYIFAKYLSVKSNILPQLIVKLRNRGQLEWSNLSNTIVDLLIAEIREFFYTENINAEFVKKEEVDNASKKPGSDPS